MEVGGFGVRGVSRRTAAVVLLFGPDGGLRAWNEAAEECAAPVATLRVGMTMAELSEAWRDGAYEDWPLSDGGTLRLRARAGSTEDERIGAARRGRLFAAASHDLRQPLAALSLLAGALDGHVADGAARELLRSMASAIDTMKTMVDGHFDLARLQAGLIEPDVAAHAMNGILTRLALDLAPRFESRRMRFSVIPCSAVVAVDAAFLERILHVFLANALRHADGGRVLLGCRRRGDQLLIGVWDRGRGLSAERLSVLRMELENGEADKRGAGGLGLGLTLAAGLARRLDLPIVAESKPGRGSFFGVLVPRTPELEEEDEEDVPPALKGRHGAGAPRVLVIEDDPMVLSALSVLLRQWGCVVVGGDSQEAAMARLDPSEGAPDLVIADLRLKGTSNGIVAIRLIAKTFGADIPGLVLTGDTDPKRLREARLSGYILLHKPVAPLALRAALGKLLGDQRLLS